MPIVFHEQSKTFHLYNKEVSYIFMILKNGQLGQLYYGSRITDRQDFSHLLKLIARPMAVCTFEGDLTFSLEHIKQEYPAYGTGDMRYPAFDILQKNGSRIVDFKYVSHSIIKGKPSLTGLPATYVENINEATTLKVTLQDQVLATHLVLSYTIYEDYPVICRNTCFTHFGQTEIMLESAMSMNVDLPDKEYEMLLLTGAWGRERNIKKRYLEHGIQAIDSMRGCSSSNFNPFIALKRKTADEFQGEVLGFSFVYSGNFLAQVEVDTYDVTRIMLGLHPHGFSWLLKKGESFQTPEVVMVYSKQGVNGMSQTFHNLYQTRLVRGKYRDQVRPILLNSWEGTYFNFNEQKIVAMASLAKKLGIELFVLDDGWFANRNSDHAGLGDWYPNLEKLPTGISGLSKKITSLGLQFGLWIEPEMVNKDSNLYRTHPTWLLATPERSMSHGRNQYVLDFSNPQVVDYIYKSLEKILKESKITYLKWDMNRCISEAYSSILNPKEQGKVMHQYMLGVYDLYNRLTRQFPDILFESCASGGARFDPGMLYYAPQGWTSDDTDAMERLKIQYGTSLVYPISSIAAHVSAIPNHQTLRNVPMETRANVAYFGAFGYELDISKISHEEQEKIVQQIQFMKTYREVIQFGTFYRLCSPFETNITAWMVVSKNQEIALVGYYRALQQVNASCQRIRLQGLHPTYKYHISIHETEHYGDELMNVGVLIFDAPSDHRGDFQSRIYVLHAKK